MHREAIEYILMMLMNQRFYVRLMEILMEQILEIRLLILNLKLLQMEMVHLDYQII